MTDWTLANCAGADYDAMFPGRRDHVGIRYAKRVCAPCPIADDCLAEHINEADGVFGGFTANERTNLNRRGVRACENCGIRFVPRIKAKRCSYCAHLFDHKRRHLLLEQVAA